jgi:zinc/manganese transport system substrate-binding protein
MTRRAWLAVLLALLSAPAAAQGLPVVAAENMYGDIARQIAGPAASVTSILSNPDDDPHLFEASPSVARALSAARIVIYNGADYDPWMDRLLASTHAARRQVIVVATLAGRKPGDNPHLWYDPAIVIAAAGAMQAALAEADPAHVDEYRLRLDRFTRSAAPLQARIASMRARFAGMPVTATEPVFGLMASALGLVMRNERFQLAVMNNTEPRPSDVAAFEADLRQHRVRALLYNRQASDNASRRLQRMAEQTGIPVVGVSETEPAGTNWQGWMTDQLAALEAALARAAR